MNMISPWYNLIQTEFTEHLLDAGYSPWPLGKAKVNGTGTDLLVVQRSVGKEDACTLLFLQSQLTGKVVTGYTNRD